MHVIGFRILAAQTVGLAGVTITNIAILVAALLAELSQYTQHAAKEVDVAVLVQTLQ